MIRGVAYRVLRELCAQDVSLKSRARAVLHLVTKSAAMLLLALGRWAQRATKSSSVIDYSRCVMWR